MISVFLIIISSFCNSIMDKISHHYYQSVFSKIVNPNLKKFFNIDSWKNKYVNGDVNQGLIKWSLLGFKFNKPVQFTDSWHLFKSLMIILFCSAIILYKPIVNPLIDLAILGLAWNCTFSLFYNYIWKLNVSK